MKGGRKLMDVAEQWAEAQGFKSAALSSSIARSEAHAFYQRLEYRIEATFHLMRRRLGLGELPRRSAPGRIGRDDGGRLGGHAG